MADQQDARGQTSPQSGGLTDAGKSALKSKAKSALKKKALLAAAGPGAPFLIGGLAIFLVFVLMFSIIITIAVKENGELKTVNRASVQKAISSGMVSRDDFSTYSQVTAGSPVPWQVLATLAYDGGTAAGAVGTNPALQGMVNMDFQPAASASQPWNADHSDMSPLEWILTYAVGKGYRSPGRGPEYYDCSGLIWAALTYTHPIEGFTAVSAWQMNNIDTYAEKIPTATHDNSNLQVGDLIFWTNYNHVAVYLGGDKVVHAANEKLGVTIRPTSDNDYRSRFPYAARIPGFADAKMVQAIQTASAVTPQATVSRAQKATLVADFRIQPPEIPAKQRAQNILNQCMKEQQTPVPADALRRGLNGTLVDPLKPALDEYTRSRDRLREKCLSMHPEIQDLLNISMATNDNCSATSGAPECTMESIPNAQIPPEAIANGDVSLTPQTNENALPVEGMPFFRGGTGRFHLTDDADVNDSLESQATFITHELSTRVEKAFAADLKTDGDGEVSLDGELDPDHSIEKDWVEAIAELPIEGMNREIAKKVYDRSLEWVIGKSLNQQGLGTMCVADPNNSGDGVGGQSLLEQRFVTTRGIGFTFDEERLRNATTIIGVGAEVGASGEDIVTAIAAAMQESNLRNLDWGDLDSIGLFQQRASWGTFEERHDPATAARKFYAALMAKGGRVGLPLWERVILAQYPALDSHDEIFGYFKPTTIPTLEYYSQYEQIAQKTVEAIGGVTCSEVGNAAELSLAGVAASGWAPPVPPPLHVNSAYGKRNYGGSNFHNGTDYRAPRNTPLYALNNGIVREVRDCGTDWSQCWNSGVIVVIEYPGGLASLYAHVDSLSNVLVNVGDQVSAGQQVAWSGSRGKGTGPHCHLTMFSTNGITAWHKIPSRLTIDPDNFLRSKGVF